MGVDRGSRLESTKSSTAQNTRSSHRSSSPVNRLVTPDKEDFCGYAHVHK
jgi:hypothetical protein